MDLRDWKRFKRSGAFRNKVKKKYQQSSAFTRNVTSIDNNNSNHQSEVNEARPGSVQNNNTNNTTPANNVCGQDFVGMSSDFINSDDSDQKCSDFFESEDDFTEDNDEEFREKATKRGGGGDSPHIGPVFPVV